MLMATSPQTSCLGRLLVAIFPYEIRVTNPGLSVPGSGIVSVLDRVTVPAGTLLQFIFY